MFYLFEALLLHFTTVFLSKWLTFKVQDQYFSPSVCTNRLPKCLSCLYLTDCLVTTSCQGIGGMWNHDFLTSPALHIASGYMTSRQEKCGLRRLRSQIDSLQRVACCHPQRREMCHRAPVWDEEACCGEWRWRWRWRSPLFLFSCLPHTIIHASILRLSFLYSHHPVLYF